MQQHLNSRQHLNFLKLANFHVNLWENGKRYRKSDLTFWKFRTSSFQSCHQIFSIYNPSPRKIASKLATFAKMLILVNVVANEIWTFFNFSSFGTYKPFFEKVIRFLERRNNSVFMMYHWFHAIINFFNRKYGSYITNFEIFWNF